MCCFFYAPAACLVGDDAPQSHTGPPVKRSRCHFSLPSPGPSYICSLGQHTGGALRSWRPNQVGSDDGYETLECAGGAWQLVRQHGSIRQLLCLRAVEPPNPYTPRPSLGNWQLFDGCVDHETAPFEGTRISFIAFSHMAYNKLPPDVVAELRALGFTAAASDGVDDPFFEKFRIDRSVLGEADRAK